MKKILLLIFFSIFAFGVEKDFLEPEEAFKTKFIKSENKINFNLVLGKDIYLYDERLKVYISKPNKVDISKEINVPKSIKYEEWQVHFDNLNLEIPFSLIQSKINSLSAEITVEFQGCSKAGLCYAPMKEKISIDFLKASNSNDQQKDTIVSPLDAQSETDLIANTLKNGNFLIVLATFFGFGLLLSLTPCVFPMIPILSSIIVKAGDKGELTASKGFFLSLVYVLSMSAAYTIAGILAGLFGANLQVALQNPYVLSIFAAIFVALAFSMFGYFKLELPLSVQNKINKTRDGKENQGILGIAIMGFLSALIVGPCVAPPLAGALVYIGQTGDAILGGMALFVMSLGMGAPLLLIGIGAGKYMPKPGGWMDSVSKIFGIVMLAVAVWMLDRVLNATIIMYLWSFLLIGAALYLKIFEHILTKLITVVIMVYGISLLLGAISGATNPLEPLSKFTSKTGMQLESNTQIKWKKVKTVDELYVAIEESNKPVMLDFYADWCVSCKELEAITFKDQTVIKKLNSFTLLKVDVTKNTDDDKKIQKEFGIVGPPALIFWDENNNEIKASQIVGYKNPKDFLDIVNRHFK